MVIKYCVCLLTSQKLQKRIKVINDMFLMTFFTASSKIIVLASKTKKSDQDYIVYVLLKLFHLSYAYTSRIPSHLP